jgi:hypothetical protein
MKETFAEYLNEIKPNDETIEVAARAFLSELTDDALPEEMKQEMAKAAQNREDVERALVELERSPQERREASLAFLCWAWQVSENRQKIRDAFRAAQSKLPVIEPIVLGLIALYGMYLLATDGKRKETRWIKHHADGSFEERIETEYASVVGPLSVLAKLLPRLPLIGDDSADDDEDS